MHTSLGNDLKTSLTDQCAEKLRKFILSGKIKTNGDFINERGLRSKLGVSRVTVRRALSLLQEENLLISIPYRGYVLGPAAYVSKGTRSPVKTSNQIFWIRPPHALQRETVHDRMIFQGATEEAEKSGLKIEICRQPLRDLVKTINENSERGLFGVALDWPEREIADVLLLEGLPVAVVEYYYEGLALDAAMQDDQDGIDKAMNLLSAEGHRQIGLVVWASAASQPLRRQSAFMTAMMRRGIVNTGLIGSSTRFDALGGREACAKLFNLKEPPTALILSHLEMASGVFDELKDRGLEPGKDIRIIAWGTPETKEAWLGGTPWAGLPLDLITWSRPEMGRMIVRCLQARRQNPAMPPLRIEIPTTILSSRNQRSSSP